MASSAMRIRQKSFQERIYLPVCISTRYGVFLHLRKGVRWWGRQDTILSMEGISLQLWKSHPAPAV